ncbi:unnamed protein product [Hyaloperonospora brassicae]|uniref:Uncharacterized protein n=1 Tax=Hyaloperonospora brassicae TaxID=162125 RepID=A0AAV0UYU5_HYABA|nr:unnamed protein product [Hyaloperonospora brassicae]
MPPPGPPSPAPSLPAKPLESVRMKRMQLILQKALDVSVHAASLVDLRACLESECRGDEDLLAAFFPPPSPESLDEANTEEVAAQAVMSLRQKVETVFQWLCETHDVETELLELEELLREAQERQLRHVAAEEKKNERRSEKESGENEHMEVEQDRGEVLQATKATPAAWIRAERLHAKLEEKKELERLVGALETKNQELDRVVEERRRVATADVQRMQRAATQLEQVRHLATEFATTL